MRGRSVRFGAGLLLGLGVALRLTGADAAPPATPAPQDVVISIGDRKVTAEQLAAQLSYEPSWLMDRSRHDANGARLFAVNWYEEELLAKAAEDDGFLARTPGLAGAARNRGRTLIAMDYAEEVVGTQVPPSDTEVQTYYTMNPARCDQPIRYHLARIGVQIPKRASAQETEAAQARLAVMQERLNTGASFGQVADELSDFTSPEPGGDLGWFEEGKLGQEEGTRIIQALAVGAVSTPIKTDKGIEIFKLLGKDEAKRKTVTECRDQIVETINSEYRKLAIRRRVDELAKRYNASMNIDAFAAIVATAKGRAAPMPEESPLQAQTLAP